MAITIFREERDASFYVFFYDIDLPAQLFRGGWEAKETEWLLSQIVSAFQGLVMFLLRGQFKSASWSSALNSHN